MKPMLNLLNVPQFKPAIVRLFSCLALVVVAQVQAADLTVEEKVKNIRTRYDEVDKDLSRCKRVKRDLPGESTEGGELTAYFSGQSLRKLVARFYGETGQALEEYYFWEDRLIFVLRVDSRYDKPLSGVVKSKSEERFYFADGVLIRWLDPRKKEVPAGSELQQRGRDWLAQAKKYSALVKKGDR
ncbi:MAG TPA: hypothetical protein VF345_08210 [Chthoniobacterales bacterium]